MSGRTVAWLDAPAGIAGDMFLGALVDAGWPLGRLEAVVRALGLDGVTVRSEAVRRGALAATKVHVLVGGRAADAVPGSDDAHPGHHAERGHGVTLVDVVQRIEGAAELPAAARAAAERVFRALAEAEGRVHGVAPSEVHFHEVGAEDALVDVVGTCVGLDDLGVATLYVGALPFGTGSVRTAHGVLPLPAPATVHLLEGHPVVPSDERHEQVTPTGAALVRALASGHAPSAGFRARRVGTGAGSFTGGRLPNVVRLLVGEVEEARGGDTRSEDGSVAAPTQAVLLETNLDDATGQEVARAIETALAAGALDAWATPATMKKGRPAVVLSVLAAPEGVGPLEALLFRETPTLGIRRHLVARTVLARRHEAVETPWGPVRIKVREGPDGPEGTVEHDDALRLADRVGVPLRRVLEAARAAWAARRGS